MAAQKPQTSKFHDKQWHSERFFFHLSMLNANSGPVQIFLLGFTYIKNQTNDSTVQCTVLYGEKNTKQTYLCIFEMKNLTFNWLWFVFFLHFLYLYFPLVGRMQTKVFYFVFFFRFFFIFALKLQWCELNCQIRRFEISEIKL